MSTRPVAARLELPWFVAGDLDGFFALALDNLVNLLLISSFCLGLLGFTPEVFYHHVLPATAVSLVIGNFFYAREARALARRENRRDVCALPYGISLFTVFAYSLLVMLPAQQSALAAGLPKAEADLIAWRAGIAAAFGTGMIEAVGGWWANQLRAVLPRAALLATPAMVGLLLISGLFFFKCVEFPVIGFSTLGLVIALYYGGMKLRGGIPASLLIMVVGTALAWIFYRGRPHPLVPVGHPAFDQIGLRLPVPVLGDLWHALPYLYPYLPVILPMGLLNLISSLQGLESAAAAGDDYPGRPALLVNGLGTVGAAAFGSPFPTTLYYGHPGWKALGARSAYSTINAVFFTVILLTGTLSLITYAVPIEAGMAILVWIGATLFIQAFSTVPVRHYPAIAMGMLPVVGGFTALVIRDAVAGAGGSFSPQLLAQVEQSRNFGLAGVFAIDAGYIFMSVIWALITVYVIERQFRRAALGAFVAALVTAVGLMHSYQVTKFDIISSIQPAWPWVGAYLLMGLVFLVTPLIARPDAATGSH
jgi:AGZA family xanthine/uracil permease-like MFS transporter